MLEEKTTVSATLIGVVKGRTIHYNGHMGADRTRVAEDDVVGLAALGLTAASGGWPTPGRSRVEVGVAPPGSTVGADSAEIEERRLALRAEMERAAARSPLGHVRSTHCWRCGREMHADDVVVSLQLLYFSCAQCATIPTWRVIECGCCGRWIALERPDHRRRYCSNECARWARRQAERTRRSAARATETSASNCGYCGQALTDRRRDARLCSNRCRVAQHRLRRRMTT